MSLVSATSNLRTFASLLGLVPFTFCQKSNKFVLYRFLPVSLFKFALSITYLYLIEKITKLVGTHTDHFSSGSPAEMIIMTTRMLAVATTAFYDVIQVFEKNLQKELYCEVMNDLVRLSENMIFKSLEMGKACRRLQRCELKIITVVVLYGSYVMYSGITASGYDTVARLVNIVYFNAHVLMIVIDSLYIGHLFVVMRSYIEYLTKRIQKQNETMDRGHLIQIHEKVTKIIEKLVRIHGMEIIASYVAANFFLSISMYMAYALYKDFPISADFGIYLILSNLSLLTVCTTTWNLVQLQETVSDLS